MVEPAGSREMVMKRLLLTACAVLCLLVVVSVQSVEAGHWHRSRYYGGYGGWSTGYRGVGWGGPVYYGGWGGGWGYNGWNYGGWNYGGWGPGGFNRTVVVASPGFSSGFVSPGYSAVGWNRGGWGYQPYTSPWYGYSSSPYSYSGLTVANTWGYPSSINPYAGYGFPSSDSNYSTAYRYTPLTTDCGSCAQPVAATCAQPVTATCVQPVSYAQPVSEAVPVSSYASYGVYGYQCCGR